eukprot:7641191-Prorocentrum_lima.AAC.1
MTSSLVGSEMCIRDSRKNCGSHLVVKVGNACRGYHSRTPSPYLAPCYGCLLYTSDAADDM